MSMKKNISKALAMAVMMSVLAGGSAYAQTFTETVVIDGARPITLNPNGSADGNQSIEIAGTNNLLSAMGSDRFEISKEGNVVAGIYAGGLTSYGSTYESFYGASGLEISSRGALDPYMAFTANNVDVGNNVIKNVGEGDITSATSTDAVNGGQLYTALQGKVDAADVYTKSDVDTKLDAKANAADVYTKAQTDSAISTAVAGKADTTYVDTKLDAKANAADVYTKSETDAAIAASAYDDTAIKADIVKKADQTDLDTETQERKDADDKLQKQINDINSGSSAGLNELNNKINQTNDRVDRVGATATALAGIHYQPMVKGQSQVAVGMGGYKGKKATALGLAYQISDRISGSVAGAANGSEHMFNVGFNYLFGQHSDKDIAQMGAVPGSVSLKEAELQSEVDSLKADNQAMKAHIAKQDAEMAELKAMVKALAAK